jgi:Tfp pilus assembly protein FimT
MQPLKPETFPNQSIMRAIKAFPGMMAPACRAGGFTLFELIVVILLLTILLGFAIPAFQGNSLSGSPEGGARQLVSAVNRLKIAALNRQSTHTLHVNLDQRHLWVTREEEKPEGEADSPHIAKWAMLEDWRIAQIRLPDDRVIRSGTVTINFYPQGYSDRAIVQIAGDGGLLLDTVIEAFLPTAFIASEDDPPAF